MVRQDIIPALVSHINLYKESGTKTHIDTGSLERLVLELEFYVSVLTHGGATTGTIKPPNTYQEKCFYIVEYIKPKMAELREEVDRLERLTSVWPYPSYEQMLHHHHAAPSLV